jgi:hypothetical protein
MREGSRPASAGMYCLGVPPELGDLPQYITIAQWRAGAAHRALSLLFSLLLSLIDHPSIEPTFSLSLSSLLLHTTHTPPPPKSGRFPRPFLSSLLLLLASSPNLPSLSFRGGQCFFFLLFLRRGRGRRGSIQCVHILLQVPLLLRCCAAALAAFLHFCAAPCPPPHCAGPARPRPQFFPRLSPRTHAQQKTPALERLLALLRLYRSSC